MRSEPSPSPEEQLLLRYVDGSLGPAEAAQVAALIAADPALAQRVAADRAINAQLAAAFGPRVDDDVPDHLRALVERTPPPRPARRWIGQVAAAVLLLAFGAGAGWFGHEALQEQPVATALPVAAAQAHRVFVTEVRHPVEVPAAEEAHLVAWLSKRLGGKVEPPPLAAYGFQLVGGRLLPGGDGPAAQFMYETAQGRRLTLYVAPEKGGEETAFRFAREGEVSVFYWIDRGFGYALIAQADRAELLPIARTVYENLGR